MDSNMTSVRRTLVDMENCLPLKVNVKSGRAMNIARNTNSETMGGCYYYFMILKYYNSQWQK